MKGPAPLRAATRQQSRTRWPSGSVPQKFKIWFQNSARFMLADGYLRIGVANPFLATWLEGHFIKDIRAAVESVMGRPAGDLVHDRSRAVRRASAGSRQRPARPRRPRRRESSAAAADRQLVGCGRRPAADAGHLHRRSVERVGVQRRPGVDPGAAKPVQPALHPRRLRGRQDPPAAGHLQRRGPSPAADPVAVPVRRGVCESICAGLEDEKAGGFSTPHEANGFAGD